LVVSLDPEKWEEEGLFDENGWTLERALELIPGIEAYDLEARSAVLVP
jgi:hypothetical protein